MREKYKAIMEAYFAENNYPFIFEEISEEVYATAADFTFTDKPFKDEIFVQKFIVDNDKISSVCALYHIDATNYKEVFDELAELFIEKYALSIRFDSDYGAIKVSMAIGEESFEDEEIDTENLLEYFTTFPALLCRMFTYALLVCIDDNISPRRMFDEVMEDEDLFIIPEDISFDIGNVE